MKIYNLLFVLFLCINTIVAQQSDYGLNKYKKAHTEAKAFKTLCESLKTQTGASTLKNKQDEISGKIKDFTAEFEKLKTTVGNSQGKELKKAGAARDELQAYIQTLKKTQKLLMALGTEQQKQNGTPLVNTDCETVKKEVAELQKENESLKAKIKALEKVPNTDSKLEELKADVKKYKTADKDKQELIKNQKKKIEKLTEEGKTLKNENLSLNKKLSTCTDDEKAKCNIQLKELNKKLTDTVAEYTSKVKSFQDSIDTIEDKLDFYKKRNSEMLRVFKEQFKESVTQLVNGSDYNSVYISALIDKCNKTYKAQLGVTYIEPIMKQLETYRVFCSAIEESKKCLGKKYDKTTVGLVLKQLRMINVSSPAQIQDKRTYIHLLQNYEQQYNAAVKSNKNQNSCVKLKRMSDCPYNKTFLKTCSKDYTHIHKYIGNY